MRHLLLLTFVLLLHPVKASAISQEQCNLMRDNIDTEAWPLIVSRYQMAKRHDAQETRKVEGLRVGVEIKLEKIFAKIKNKEILEAECSRLLAEENYLSTLENYLIKAELESKKEKLNYLNKLIISSKEELKKYELLFAEKNLALDNFLAFKQGLGQMELKKIDLEAEIDILSSKLLVTNINNLSLAELRNNFLQTFKQTPYYQANTQKAMPFGFAVQGGYETAKQENLSLKEARPYIILKANFALGALAQTHSSQQWQEKQQAWRMDDPNGSFKKAQELEDRIHIELTSTKAKLDIIVQQLESLEGHFQAISVSHGSLGQTVANRLQKEIEMLRLEEIYLRKKEHILQEESSPKQELNSLPFAVTKGDIEDNGELNYRVKSTQMRLRTNDAITDEIEVEFTYLGDSKDTQMMGSGLLRHQFGVYLRALNQCNALYIMLRLDDPHLVVQEKINPNLSTHDECTNHGYQTVKPVYYVAPKKLAINEKVKIHAKIIAQNLQVTLDNKLIWQGSVAKVQLPKEGYGGIRTDNVQIDFHFLGKKAAHGNQ